MDIINPSCTVLAMTGHPELPYQYSPDPNILIEAAGRTCYKSEDKITEDSADRFVNARIDEGHLSMLEHSWDVRIFSVKSVKEVQDKYIMDDWNKYLYIGHAFYKSGGKDHYYVIAGNMRAWRETYTPTLYRYPSLTEKEIRYHAIAFKEPRLMRATVRVICDRGVSHELVRHRNLAISQESTRYVNYKKKSPKFIMPCWGDKDHFTLECAFDKERAADLLWLFACWVSEKIYNRLISLGWKPEQARSVLINSLKAELVVSGTLEEWQRIFNQRLFGTTGKPHPQMKEIMGMIYKEFHKLEPTFFPEEISDEI